MGDTSGLIFDAFKELLWDSLVKAALAKLFASVTLLSWGPIAALISWIVTKYSDELYAALKLFIEVELIVYKNKELQQEYGASVSHLRVIAQTKGIESTEFREARDADKRVLEPFVRYAIARSA